MRLFLALLLCTLGLGAEEGLSARFREIALAHAEQAASDGQYQIRCLREPQMPHLPEGEVQIEAIALSKREPIGPFFVTLRIRVNGRLAAMVRVDLEGTWKGQVLKATGNLARKSVPTPDQLERTSFEGVPPAGALTEWPEGMRLRAPVSAGRILTRADLEPIPLVQTGDRVRLTLLSGGLSIGTEAKAMNPGGLGDRVRLEVQPRQRPIQAVITGRGQATLRWSES